MKNAKQKLKIRKGDIVAIMSGKDRSKIGKVIKVFPARTTVRSGGPDTNRLVVEGVNLRKRRERARTPGKPGQVIESPAPFAAAKALIWCPDCGRGRRIGVRQEGQKKLRICLPARHELPV